MGLKHQVVHSVKWNVVSIGYKTIIQLLRISVLTRYLSMADFGLIAIALMLVSFTEIFVELGFTVPIIHKQNITKNEYSSVFWMNILMSLAIYLVLYFSAPLISEFYDDIALENIVRILCIVVIINAFGKVFQTIRTKNLDFKFISIVSIVSSTIGFGSIWVLAYLGYGIYSLVYGTIVETIIRQGVYFIKGLENNTISFHFNPKEITEYFKIGGYQIGSQLMDFVANKLDIIIIGKLIGMDNLGIYNLAKELILKCYSMGTALTRSVFMAALAKVQSNIDKFKAVYDQYVEKYSYLTVIAYMALFFLANPLCDIMYGDKADVVIPVFKALVGYGIFTSFIAPMASVELSLGRTDIALLWTGVISILTLLFITAGSYFGLNGIIIGETILALVSFFLCWKLVLHKLISVSLKEYLSPYMKPILFLIPSLFISLIPSFFFELDLLLSVITTFIFCSTYICFMIKSDSMIKNQLKQLISREK